MLFGAVISFVCLLRISTGSRVILVEDAQTCYRRVVPGSRASSRYVERVVRNAGTLSSCERACFNEPRFHCETFNFRLDPANGGKGGCELMSKPVKEIHPDDLIRDALYDIYEVDRNTLLPDCLPEGSKLKDNRVVKADGSRPPDGHNDTGQHHHYHHHRHHEHEHPHVLYEERREHPYHTKFEHRVHLDRHNYVPYSVGEGHHHQHHHDHHHEHGDREHGYGHGDHDHDHDHEHDDRFDRDGYSHGHGHSRSDEHHWNPTSSEEFDYNSLDHQGRRGPPYGRRYGEGFDDGYSGGGWNDYDRQCSSRRRSGSSLGHSNVRRAIRTSGVLACETACYSESSFKCVSYSYRYSHGFDDNCFLSDRPFASLGFNEDDYSDVFSMDNTRYCEDRHRKKGPWLESECFWLVRSDRRLVDGTSLSVSSLGACQAECVRSKPFFCRSFSFRFGPPTRGDSAFNCVLSPRDGRSLGPHDGPNEGRRGSIETAFGHELYARGSFGRGCEPLIETPSQECFVVYPGGNSGARLKPAAIRASARVANEDDCKHTCYLLDYCMSFSFDSDRLLPSDVDNCFMSDVRLRDLRMGLDYENSIDDWLFAFDMFNPNCWAERKHGDYHHHHHGHRGSAEGHSEPYPPPLYPPLSGPPPPPPGPPLGPPGPSGPLGPGLSIGPLGPPPILPITDLAPPIGPGPIISGPPRPTASDRDLTYAHGFGYGSSGGDYFSGSSGSSGFSGGSGFSGSSGSGIGGGFSSYEDRSYDIYDEGPGSWSVYTVKGYPCRAGTRCAPNHIAGFWSCEIEGGEIGSWDYCCSPAHKCGYSDGVDTPWCYVGDSKSQWRPCSDRYFPYMSQHHHHQHHRDEQDYHHHRLHGESHHSYHSSNELSHGSYPENADRKYWDDLYKNGPQSYYDERGNPRPGYVRIPTMDKTHIHYHHNYGPDKSGDQRWVPVKPPSYENPQDFLEPPRPGGFDIPRYWPVAYLHREKPPNGTFDDRLNSIGDRDGHRRPDYRDRDRDYDRREYEDRRRPGYDDRRGSGERHPTYDDRRPSYDDRRPGQDDRRPGQDDRRPGHDDRRPGYDDRRPNTRPEQDNKRRPSIADKKPDEKNKTRNDGDSSKSNSDSKNRNTTVAPSSTPSDFRNGRKDEEDITNASVAESSNTDDVMVLISSSSDDRNTTDNPDEDTEKSSIKVGTDDKSVTRRSDDNAWPVAHGIRDQLEFFDDDEANIEVISLGEQKRSTQKTNAELLDSEVRQIEEIGRFLGAKQRGLLVEKRSQNENDARQLVTSQQRNATAMNRATIQRISKEQLRKERQRPESPETETTESTEAMIVNGKQFFDATIDEETTRLEQIRNRTTMFKQRKGRRPPYDPKEARLRLQEHRNRQNA